MDRRPPKLLGQACYRGARGLQPTPRATGGRGKKFRAWLELKAAAATAPQLDPGAPDYRGQLAVKAWNIMGGLEWDALPAVVEVLGITDVEGLILLLCEIRNHQDKP
jgi:hypothetical protein